MRLLVIGHVLSAVKTLRDLLFSHKVNLLHSKGYDRLHHNLLDFLPLVCHVGSLSLPRNRCQRFHKPELLEILKMAAVRSQGIVDQRLRTFQRRVKYGGIGH